MALDPKTGCYVFDDQSERLKLKEWYDQVRTPVEKVTTPDAPKGAEDKKADCLKQRAF
jgi:hypothetical protein